MERKIYSQGLKNMGNMGRISRKKKEKLRKERRTGVTVVEDSIKTLIV